MSAIAIIGGSGALGFGLAVRLACAGQDIIIGSRRAESATKAADELAALCREHNVEPKVKGLTNPDAASAADIVILAVPFAQQDEALGAIRNHLDGKIVVDTTVPLMPPKVGTVQLPKEGCSALRVQAMVGQSVRVVSAFQNVAADKLRSMQPLECDVLVAGDDKEARQIVIGLAEAAGMRAFHAGPLANAAAAEALTSVLITLNRQFKSQSGIRLVGIGE